MLTNLYKNLIKNAIEQNILLTPLEVEKVTKHFLTVASQNSDYGHYETLLPVIKTHCDDEFFFKHFLEHKFSLQESDYAFKSEAVYAVKRWLQEVSNLNFFTKFVNKIDKDFLFKIFSEIHSNEKKQIMWDALNEWDKKKVLKNFPSLTFKETQHQEVAEILRKDEALFESFKIQNFKECYRIASSLEDSFFKAMLLSPPEFLDKRSFLWQQLISVEEKIYFQNLTEVYKILVNLPVQELTKNLTYLNLFLTSFKAHDLFSFEKFESDNNYYLSDFLNSEYSYDVFHEADTFSNNDDSSFTQTRLPFLQKMYAGFKDEYPEEAVTRLVSILTNRYNNVSFDENETFWLNALSYDSSLSKTIKLLDSKAGYNDDANLKFAVKIFDNFILKADDVWFQKFIASNDKLFKNIPVHFVFKNLTLFSGKAQQKAVNYVIAKSVKNGISLDRAYINMYEFCDDEVLIKFLKEASSEILSTSSYPKLSMLLLKIINDANLTEAELENMDVISSTFKGSVSDLIEVAKTI